uniref:Uncharacterized protein n=1 Tax=viral metagenome TaxID=1070528 RepID=A0A6C0JAH7_9ZZZZ
MVKYTTAEFNKDLKILDGLITRHNKIMNGGGYSDAKPLSDAGEAKVLEHVGYPDQCSPTVNQVVQNGGAAVAILPLISSICKILAPVGKTQLITTIVLLALNELGKKQKGGGMMDSLGRALAPLGKNQLLVLVSLLLINYFMKLHKKRSKKMRGGSIVQLSKLLGKASSSNATISSFLSALNSGLSGVKTGGGAITGVLSQVHRLAMPVGASSFSVAAILVLLNNLFKRKLGKQRGGGSLAAIVSELSAILTPQGLSAFLASVGLVVVATNKKTVKKAVKKAEKTVKRVSKSAKKTVKKTAKKVKKTVKKL